MGAMGSNSPKFTRLLSNAVTPQTTRPKCLCLLHPIISSLRHYSSFTPHFCSLGDLIFCHVFLIFTFMCLAFIAPFLSPPIYMFLILMGVWRVRSDLLNRVHYQERGNADRLGAHAEVCTGGGGGLSGCAIQFMLCSDGFMDFILRPKI
jgi:hypothetical protein